MLTCYERKKVDPASWRILETYQNVADVNSFYVKDPRLCPKGSYILQRPRDRKETLCCFPYRSSLKPNVCEVQKDCPPHYRCDQEGHICYHSQALQRMISNIALLMQSHPGLGMPPQKTWDLATFRDWLLHRIHSLESETGTQAHAGRKFLNLVALTPLGEAGDFSRTRSVRGSAQPLQGKSNEAMGTWISLLNPETRQREWQPTVTSHIGIKRLRKG